jgi:pimeloyl-ACP methyl ester carboxylesterase
MTSFRTAWALAAVLALQAVAGPTFAAEKPAAGSFDANGVKIVYSVQGKGVPVVLIHGWMSSAWMNWDLPGITALLAKDYQVITLDVRGHGRSDKPTKEEAYGPELAEDIARLLDHLKIKKAHIVGYSMGGMITARFIVKHPDRALSGTLGGMGWVSDGGVGQRIFVQIGKNDPQPRPVALCGRSLARLALTENEIKSIRVPVTILVGDKDGPIKRLYVDPLQPVRKDWPIVEIKDANHITCIFKAQFHEEIQKWLARQKPG